MNKAMPRIGIPADVKIVAGDTFHAVGEKYLAAVAHGAGALPVVLPALAAGAEMASLQAAIGVEDMLATLDGLFLTGSVSNLSPAAYGQSDPGVGPFDSQRDETILPLLRAALEMDLPVLAVCRGFRS